MGSKASGERRKTVHTEDRSAFVLQTLGISLFVILLAFFILLNAIAVVDEKKVTAAIGSLLASFSGDTGGYSVIREPGEVLPGMKIQTESGTMDLSKVFAAGEEWAQKITIRKNPRGTLVQIPCHELFEPAGPALSSSGKNILDKLCMVLLENNQPIEISAHASGQTTEAEQGMSSRELTALQAMNILRHFIVEGKLPPERLTACGWGSNRPAYADDTEETRAMNRRIELLVVHQGISAKPQSGFTFKRFFFRTLE